MGKRARQYSDVVTLIAELNILEKKGMLSEAKIKDELQSYDLLENERYNRLR